MIFDGVQLGTTPHMLMLWTVFIAWITELPVIVPVMTSWPTTSERQREHRDDGLPVGRRS